MEYGRDQIFKETYCGERKFTLQKTINILVKYTTSGLHKELAIQKMSKQSMN